MKTYPLAYHITIHTYGTWLPGDARGWNHRGDRTRYPPSPGLEAYCKRRLRYPVVVLAAPLRELTRDAILATCRHRSWDVHALVVERTHIHIVIAAQDAPERIMQTLKSWATRVLRERGHLVDHPHPWAEHGSSEYLFATTNVQRAVGYVLDDHHRGARAE